MNMLIKYLVQEGKEELLVKGIEIVEVGHNLCFAPQQKDSPPNIWHFVRDYFLKAAQLNTKPK